MDGDKEVQVIHQLAEAQDLPKVEPGTINLLMRTANTFWAGAKLCFGVMALVTIALLFISLNRAHPVETSISVLAISLIAATIYHVVPRRVQTTKAGHLPYA